MDLTLIRTVAWTVGDRRFTFDSPGDPPGRPARLQSDDGRSIDLSEAEWRAAAQALVRVLGGRSAKPKPGRAGKQWTEEEDERLASLVEAGQAVAEVAAALDRSRAAIRMRMTAQGLTEAT